MSKTLATESIVIRGNDTVHLMLRDGFVVWAMGDTPKRFLGLNLAQCKRLNRRPPTKRL